MKDLVCVTDLVPYIPHVIRPHMSHTSFVTCVVVPIVISPVEECTPPPLHHAPPLRHAPVFIILISPSLDVAGSHAADGETVAHI